ncbi:MAG: adenylyltransferase/cytidyltransferase family protein, partial [Lactobacillales bacterium]|nr:adenylyltransferase/cytidyltransferase family protein [Lactobacillales bacterium]
MFFKIKKLISKLTCISLAISLGCSFSVPAVRADTSPYTEFEICNREGGMGNCGGQGGNYTHWAHRLDMFKDDILQAFKFLNGKRIIICSNDSAFLDNFKVLKPEFDIVHKDSIESVNFANYDYVIDTIYAPPFLQTVYKSKNVISFIEVYKSILYEKVLQFFKDNKIQYYFFEVPEKSKLKNLDDFEREMFSGKCPSNMEETREVESFSEILDKLFPDNQRCRDYLMNFDYSQIQHYNNGRYKVRMDGSNDYNNVVNGVRITPDMPENFRNKAHFFGTCTVAGHYVTDEFTVTNYMQKRINEHFADTYGVVNYGTTFDDSMNDFERMLDTAYKPGDVVININHKSCPVFCKIAQQHGIEIIKTSPLFSRPHDHGYCMFDDPAHLNDVGNALIADFVYSRVEGDLARQIEISEDAEIKFEHVKKDVGLTQQTKELDAYVKSLNKIKLEDAESKNIGSIVMNCNPFTLGHRYLIEEALKRVDHLYIFVVQEDMSVFPFIDRIDLVKRGTSDLRNVTVLPSGSWIISTKTFPEYFSKERLQAMTIDPSIDVEIFGEHIAPALGIKIRFAGEEPLDQITRQY